jgi:hypothetical protein
MRQGKQTVQVLLLAGVLASPALLGGCFFHHHPYSPWGSVEEPRYEQWERSTHRDHKQFDQRGDDEQREYWQWRSSHS